MSGMKRERDRQAETGPVELLFNRTVGDGMLQKLMEHPWA